MKLKKIIFIITSVLAAPVFAIQHMHSSAPLNSDEMMQVKKNLYANILTQDNVVKKNDNGLLITSIPGAVLASPSNKEKGFSQDYQFHWMRDAALVMSTLTSIYSESDAAEQVRLKLYMQNYLDFEFKAQSQVSKPGENTLGQPKFNLDGTVWEGQWTRPQNDGPALRALAMMNIANIYYREGDVTYVENNILPALKKDLDYIAVEWSSPSYDVWEEVSSRQHFFNNIVQRKALLRGSEIFKMHHQDQLAQYYITVAERISQSLLQLWDADQGCIVETLDQQHYKGGGLDTTIILGVIYGDLEQENDAFALDQERVMRSIYQIRHVFAGIYNINKNHPTLPPLLGRYPGDIYDGNHFLGGNPWILTSNLLAQYYYSLANLYLHKKTIHITGENIAFFKQIRPDLVMAEGDVAMTMQPKKFNKIVSALIVEGDRYIQRIKRHQVCYQENDCMHYAEQLTRTGGRQTSARDLTWGYATFISAMKARAAAVKLQMST